MPRLIAAPTIIEPAGNKPKRIEEFARKAAETGTQKGKEVIVKKHRVVEPAKLVRKTYLETKEDVSGFLDDLRQELETGIANNERIQIR